MSAAAETATANRPARRGGGRKLILIAALAVGLAGAGGTAWFVKAKRDAAAAAAAHAEGEDEDGGGAADGASEHADGPRTPPAFLPLETFIVNLADRDGERFAQIGITLELEDAQAADLLKAYMPAIRNGILMVIAHKTSQELLTREGKEKLADEILREAVRPLGLPGRDAKAGKGGAPAGPVRNVHFSNFIMQ